MIELTDEQRAAVESEAHETLVVAGAGSGKTRVLTARILHLLQNRGASPSDLMVLTFTRRAAGEMLGRVQAALVEAGETPQKAETMVREMLAGTFHSVALRMIRQHGHLIGYRGCPTVIDEADSEMALLTAAEQLGYVKLKAKPEWRHQLSLRKIRRYLDAYYTRGEMPAPSEEPGANFCERIIHAYLGTLAEANALDYGLLVLNATKLLCENPSVLTDYRGRVRHVLIDEAQDTNPIQHRLLSFFAPPAELFMVGDRRQAIYGFRGSNPCLMTDQHQDAQVFDLERCFRCPAPVVQAVNALISHNNDPLCKPMLCANERIAPVDRHLGRCADIVSLLSDLNHVGFGWGDMAVLARNHRTLRRLAELCREAGVPHHHVGTGFDICDQPAFRRVHAYLRLLVNPCDEMAFMRLSPWVGGTDYTHAQIRAEAGRTGASSLTAFRSLVPDSWLANLGELTLDSQLDEALDQIPPEAMAGIKPIQNWWKAWCPNRRVGDALAQYACRDSQDDLRADNRVTLATVHTVKGLEWPVVLLVECNEGTLPSAMSLRESAGVEEERRVAYVAMTRAKERLIVHFRRFCDQAKGRNKRLPSRFLSEANLLAKGEPANELRDAPAM